MRQLIKLSIVVIALFDATKIRRTKRAIEAYIPIVERSWLKPHCDSDTISFVTKLSTRRLCVIFVRSFLRLSVIVHACGEFQIYLIRPYMNCNTCVESPSGGLHSRSPEVTWTLN